MGRYSLAEIPTFGNRHWQFGLFGGQFHPKASIGGGQSLWAQTLVETEILGVLALLFLVVVYFKVIISALRKAKNTSWHPYFLGYLACFFAMMVQYLASFDRLPLYFWVFSGISMATVKLLNKEEIGEK